MLRKKKKKQQSNNKVYIARIYAIGVLRWGAKASER